jgi:hypothetical protein
MQFKQVTGVPVFDQSQMIAALGPLSFDQGQSESDWQPLAWGNRSNRITPMDATTILILSGIVLAFALFASALLWGDFRSRQFGK